MGRPILVILLMLLGANALADTTNRALRVSPMPAIFVGGVGLLCELKGDDASRDFFVLTKDRNTLGWADLSKEDDIGYDIFKTRRSPDYYFAEKKISDTAFNISLHRKNLTLSLTTVDDGGSATASFVCKAMSVSDVHNAAKLELQKLLNGNRI